MRPRFPYHVNVPRWVALYREGPYRVDYDRCIGSSDHDVGRHVELGVMRWRTTKEPQDWYNVMPTKEWEWAITWQKKTDILLVDREAFSTLFETLYPSAPNMQSVWENADHCADKWYTYNDPYLHATEVVRMELKGLLRTADVLAANGMQLRDLWNLGLVRNRPQEERRWAHSGLSLQVHPIARPHLRLWERWQDILMRTDQTDRFMRLVAKLTDKRMELPPWPIAARR